MVSELRVRGAGALSPRRERPLLRQAVSRFIVLPQPVRPVFLTRKGPVNQGGTTKSFKGCRPCFVARMAAFFSFLPALAVHLILIEGAQDAYV